MSVRDYQGTPYLTNHIVGYAKEEGFIADRIAPVMEVPAESGTFYVVPFDWGRRLERTGQGEISPAPESQPPIATGTFTTDRHAHKVLLTDRKRDIAMKSPEGFKGIVDHHSELPARIILIKRESLLATALNTTGNYFSSAHYTTLTGDDQWDQFATSNPQQDVITYARTIHTHSGIPLRRLSLVIGSQVYDVLIQHPHVKAQVQYVQKTNPEDIGPSQLAAYFGVKEVIVGEEFQVTSAIGAAAEAGSYLWGKNAFLVYVDPAPNSQVPTAGSLLTVSTLGRKIPQVRTYRIEDPLGTYFLAEAQFGIVLGAKTGEGLRTAARLAAVIS